MHRAASAARAHVDGMVAAPRLCAHWDCAEVASVVVRIREADGLEVWEACPRHRQVVVGEAIDTLSPGGCVEVTLPL